METEFIYWRHHTPAGIKVEEISGAEDRSGRLWREMALQIYCENGKDVYRQIGHYRNGAPFLEGEDSRISLTHTGHLLAVATLPRTPEADLRVFSTRTAMGIDAEKVDREQARKIRDRFLGEEELKLVDAGSTEANVLAWTVKEALYKAALGEAKDFRADLRILELPRLGTAAGDPLKGGFGKAEIIFHDEDGTAHAEPMQLYSWASDGYLLTLAYSPACAKAGKAGAKS